MATWLLFYRSWIAKSNPYRSKRAERSEAIMQTYASEAAVSLSDITGLEYAVLEFLSSKGGEPQTAVALALHLGIMPVEAAAEFTKLTEKNWVTRWPEINRWVLTSGGSVILRLAAPHANPDAIGRCILSDNERHVLLMFCKLHLHDEGPVSTCDVERSCELEQWEVYPTLHRLAYDKKLLMVEESPPVTDYWWLNSRGKAVAFALESRLARA